MAPSLVLYANGRFGRPYRDAVLAECRSLGAELILVRREPVRSMSRLRRRRTRITRPLRERLDGRRLGCRVWYVEDVNGPAAIRRVPDGAHGLVAGYSQIFGREAIERFATLVNLHPSLLPYYRGPAPGFWCMRNEEERSGFTLHEVTEEVDAGPILRQGVVRIAGTAEPHDVITAAAVPVVREWVRHLLLGVDFPRISIDAASVYRVRDGYRSLPETLVAIGRRPG